ncbi:hypothetical protein D3C73_737870 [compost metagenome]
MPGAIAAVDGVVELRTAVAVPEAERKAGRVDEIDLPGDRGLHGHVASTRHCTKREIIVEKVAVVIEYAVDSRPEDAAGRDAHIDRGAVEGEVAGDLDEIIEPAADGAGLSELHVEDRARIHREAARNGERANPIASGS